MLLSLGSIYFKYSCHGLFKESTHFKGDLPKRILSF